MLRPTPPTATRPWSPLSDPEWAALAPLLPRSLVRDLRHRMNCILAVAAHGVPWVPAGAQGPFWPTLYRHYHRWARAGAWSRLHRAAEAPAAPPALRALADWAAALDRRAARIVARAADKSLKPKAGTRAKPLPAPAFPPDRPSRASTGLSRISPISAGLGAIAPPSVPRVPAAPRCPGVARPSAGWREGPAARPPLAPQYGHPPRAAAGCRTGEGKRAA